MKIKNYMILDTETATLPFVNEWELLPEQKKKIAIAKPLVYDIGWTIANRAHGIAEKKNFLVAETFSVPAVFNTAYYASKRPIYLKMIEEKTICVKPWREIMQIMLADLEKCAYCCAYNAMFDFKKAIIFTETYINQLYSTTYPYQKWEEDQKQACRWILTHKQKDTNPDFDKDNFVFRGKKYPMLDIWGLACIHILNNSNYKKTCLKNGNLSNSGLFFSTNAEVAKQYLSKQFDFIEDHTALSDAEIETEILFYALKKGKVIVGITYFPFRVLGDTIKFIENSRGITKEMAVTVAKKINEYLPEEKTSSFHIAAERKLYNLCGFIQEKWG